MRLAAALAGCSVSRNFNHGLRVYLTGIGYILPSSNDKKTGGGVYFTLAYEDDIPKWIRHARARLGIAVRRFKRRNFVLPRDHEKAVQSMGGVGGSYVKATRASS